MPAGHGRKGGRQPAKTHVATQKNSSLTILFIHLQGTLEVHSCPWVWANHHANLVTVWVQHSQAILAMQICPRVWVHNFQAMLVMQSLPQAWGLQSWSNPTNMFASLSLGPNHQRMERKAPYNILIKHVNRRVRGTDTVGNRLLSNGFSATYYHLDSNHVYASKREAYRTYPWIDRSHQRQRGLASVWGRYRIVNFWCFTWTYR